MAATVLDGLDAVRAAAGTHLGRSDWIEVDQERLDRFADATGDAASTYLVLALTNLFMPQIVEVRGVSLGVNYGTDEVRFPAAVAAGDRIRGGGELVEVADVKGGVQTRIRITVEIEGRDDPACTVDALSRWLA
jgi:acyl dehydratase